MHLLAAIKLILIACLIGPCLTIKCWLSDLQTPESPPTEALVDSPKADTCIKYQVTKYSKGPKVTMYHGISKTQLSGLQSMATKRPDVYGAVQACFTDFCNSPSSINNPDGLSSAIREKRDGQSGAFVQSLGNRASVSILISVIVATGVFWTFTKGSV